MIQPDIIAAEHSGERCPSYGIAVTGGEERSLWLDGLDRQSDNEAEAEVIRLQYCTQQLTADDYAATFVTTSGEFPGLLLMM